MEHELAIISGNVTDEAIEKYIDEQEGEPVHEERSVEDKRASRGLCERCPAAFTG